MRIVGWWLCLPSFPALAPLGDFSRLHREISAPNPRDPARLSQKNGNIREFLTDFRGETAGFL